MLAVTWHAPYDPTSPKQTPPETQDPAAQTRPRFQLVGAGFACLVLLLGLIGLPPASSAHLVTDANDLLASCGSDRQNLEPCILDKLGAVVLAKGAESGFQILENVTAQASLAGDAHHLAHELGRTALAYYNSTPEALRHCPLTLASGCFHGMMERHFANAGPPHQASDLTVLCTARDGRNHQFQCLHGLGHGLDMASMHNLPQALDWCSLLPDAWSQEGCAGGAFMENTVGDTTMQMAGMHMDGMQMHGMTMNSTWVRMKADDLLYPCDAVAQKWWHSCYWLQTSVMLELGKSLEEAFRGCDQAPHRAVPIQDVPYGYDGVCYESAGRDAASPGRTHGDTSAIVQLCMEGQFNLRGRCMYGAVQTLMNNDGRTDPGFAFCNAVPLRQKADCYSGVGGMVNALTRSYPGRIKECQRAEYKYVQVCLKAALV